MSTSFWQRQWRGLHEKDLNTSIWRETWNFALLINFGMFWLGPQLLGSRDLPFSDFVRSVAISLPIAFVLETAFRALARRMAV